MRLLYLSGDPGVPVFGPKGASVHLRSMASALHELGHDVLIASPRVETGANRLPATVRCAEIPAVVPQRCANDLEVLGLAERQAQAVIELARRERRDAIYERYSLGCVAGARASATLGVPLVLEVNAPLREEARRFRELHHESALLQAEQETFAAAHKIFAVSNALARWLAGAGTGVEERRIEVAGNAPPDWRFPDRPEIPAPGDVTVGFAGGLKPWHGIETLVRGFALALRSGARMRLEILGTGPAEVFVDEARLPDARVLRHGHLPHEAALAVLARWDVGVAPFSAIPDFYFSPLKLFEYMAAGLCPVVSDVGELAAIVEHGRAGIVVPAGDAQALARALLSLDRDRRRMRDLGVRAQAIARVRPTWGDNAVRAMQAIFDASAVPALLAGDERA